MELSNVAKIGIAAFGKLTGKSGGGLRKVSADNTSKMITGYKEKSEYVSKNGVTSTVYLMDCMEGMKQLQRNENILAVVDPPYGIGDKLTQGGTWASKYAKGDADWDIAPKQEYWNELFRVSKNQIVWGGNYFALPMNRCFLIWDKVAHMDTLADCEYAWTSFDRNAKIFKHVRNTSETRIHICQKPIKLYEWIFKNFAVEGNLILDTHLGSGSSRIAAERAGLNFIGFELDADYYHAQEKRFKNHVSQLTLF